MHSVAYQVTSDTQNLGGAGLKVGCSLCQAVVGGKPPSDLKATRRPTSNKLESKIADLRWLARGHRETIVAVHCSFRVESSIDSCYQIG